VKATGILASHYVIGHLSIESKDMTPHDSDDSKLCYTCPHLKCEFQTEPIDRDELSNAVYERKRMQGRLILFRHCLKLHEQANNKEEKEEKDVVGDLDEDEEETSSVDDQLIEGKEFFKCPQEGCNFSVQCLQDGQSVEDYRASHWRVRERKRRRTVGKLGRHFMMMHDFPLVTNFKRSGGSHPCVRQVEGKGEGYQCPRCEYFISWSGKSGSRDAYDSFHRHYSLHLYKDGKKVAEVKPLPVRSHNN
jgi:hypothetical protein